jgi:hypothetical protein
MIAKSGPAKGTNIIVIVLPGKRKHHRSCRKISAEQNRSAWAGSAEKSGTLAILQEFEKEVGVGTDSNSIVVGCKCLG